MGNFKEFYIKKHLKETILQGNGIEFHRLHLMRVTVKLMDKMVYSSIFQRVDDLQDWSFKQSASVCLENGLDPFWSTKSSLH